MKGLILEARYELLELIATGGMGQVWQGKDLELDRPVAVKILREEYAGEEGYLKRFRAEARHTAALSHEAIAALYDYGELDGRAYIVMELVPGRPLSDIIEENPAGIAESKVVPLLKALAQALDAAHVKGVVHRDVKPENVLIDEANDWALKITDFGIARSQDQARLTKTGLVMGTAQYLSPEQAMGRQATSLSDVYALGIVAYEMLTGGRPFTGVTQVEIAMAQVKDTPPELPEKISADLRKLVMMMLAKAPANRPRSAAAVVRILSQIQLGETPQFETSLSAPRATQTTGQRVSYSANSATSATEPPTLTGRAGRGRKSKSSASRTPNPISPTGTQTAAMPLAQVAAKAVTIPSSSTHRAAGTVLSSNSANATSASAHSANKKSGDDFSAASRRGTSTGKSVGKISLQLSIVLAVIGIALVLALLSNLGIFNSAGMSEIKEPTTLAQANFIEWNELAIMAEVLKGTV